MALKKELAFAVLETDEAKNMVRVSICAEGKEYVSCRLELVPAKEQALMIDFDQTVALEEAPDVGVVAYLERIQLLFFKAVLAIANRRNMKYVLLKTVRYDVDMFVQVLNQPSFHLRVIVSR